MEIKNSAAPKLNAYRAPDDTRSSRTPGKPTAANQESPQSKPSDRLEISDEARDDHMKNMDTRPARRPDHELALPLLPADEPGPRHQVVGAGLAVVGEALGAKAPKPEGVQGLLGGLAANFNPLGI